MSTQTGTESGRAVGETDAGVGPGIRNRGRGLLLYGLSIRAMMVGASAPSPFYPALQQRLGLDAIGITVAFAIYAVALLATLLIAGSISDHVGRRPVVTVGFVLLAVSVALLWDPATTGALLAGRVVQGVASGALLSTLSASVTDFAPPGRPRTAALVNAVAPMLGLGIGAVLAGVALQAAPAVAVAATAVFPVLAVVYLVLAAAAWSVPETSPRREGWRAALRPRVAVPASARRLFVVGLPVVLAGWATGGLFLSLGATIVRIELHLDGHLAQGLVIGLLPLSGAAAVLVLRRRSPRTSAIYGSIALAVGTVLTLVAIAAGSFPGYLAAVVVAGTGFGSAFVGTVGSLVPTVALHQRAELFAALYTVSYLAFGVPAAIAGLLVTLVGLPATTVGYGAVVAVLAAVAAVVRIAVRPVREG